MRSWSLAFALVAALVAGLGCDGSRRPAVDAPRGVYVRDAAALIEQPAARARLSGLVTRGRVTEVIPYGLGPLLTSSTGRITLAAWIDELHRRGARVVVPVAGLDRVRALAVLITEHPVIWIDGLVTEYEYWNQADRGRGLDELLALVDAMRAAATTWPHPSGGVRIGAYLGYPTAAEASRLAAVLDFVYLDYSVDAPAHAWSHVHATGGPLRDRFAWFAQTGVEVWPIFYAAGEVDMGSALRARGTTAAEDQFRIDLAADPAYGGLPLAGVVYFTIEAMPDPD